MLENVTNQKLLAAVDIGSNSIHLIIARVNQGAMQTIQVHKERVQLAAGLTKYGLLDKGAFERGLECLTRMGQVLANHQPDVVRVVATHALRVAGNRNEFIAEAENALGYRVEVISGAEEARVIFLGVAHFLTLQSNTLIIDIGGGSTELAVGKGFEPEFTASAAMGCVSYRDRYFHKGLTESAFRDAHYAALQALEAFLPKLNDVRWDQVYATSGTAKALGSIVSLLDEKGDGLPSDLIELKALKRVRQTTIEKGEKYLKALDVGSDRLSLVPSGLAILIATMEALGVKSLAYQNVALREGVLYEMDDQMRHPDIAQRTRQSLQSLYNIDAEHSARVAATCEWLIENSLSKKLTARINDYRPLLQEAAQLHEVGLQISAGGLQKHSAYILMNSDLPGFTQENQQILAQLVGRYRKRLNFKELPDFPHLALRDFQLLVYVLRFAVILNIPRRKVDLTDVQIRIDNKQVECSITPEFQQAHPLIGADLLREKRYLGDLDVALSITVDDKPASNAYNC